MNEFPAEIFSHDLEINLPVEARFAEFLEIASKLGYEIMIQHVCIAEFGHSKLDELNGSGMEQVMKLSEAIVYDAAVQLQVMA